MSCFVIDAESYKKFADEVYFLTDSKEVCENVKRLYELNQIAYNVRYREDNEVEKLDWKPEDGRTYYVESPKEKYERMVYFLACVEYQCRESDELEKETMELIGNLLFSLSWAIFHKKSDKYQWGEY